MRRKRAGFLILLASGTAALAAAAGGPEVRRRSPRAVAALVLAADPGAAATATIEYGAPVLAGRRMLGELVPWNEVWRAGDDEATRLTIRTPLRFGPTPIEPGSYSLFIVPRAPASEEPWLLLVNSVADQWGAYNHDPARDVARVALDYAPAVTPLERMSIAWEVETERSGRLRVVWEAAVLTVPFEVAAAAAADDLEREPTATAPPSSPSARPRR